ncbi:MAG: hypothetical protein H8E13_04975 [Actinobacteria bacterium]|nr:hypothetical protein [Actinomycetota bacterium]
MTQLFIDFARSKMKMTINGAYDFVDVQDVAEGLILAAGKGRTGQYYILPGERINMSHMGSSPYWAYQRIHFIYLIYKPCPGFIAALCMLFFKFLWLNFKIKLFCTCSIF